MGKIFLYDWADKNEGVVKTHEWGSCRSETCMHVSHDPYFRYYVTEIDGEVLWEGEYGEMLVKSGSGRIFVTKCRRRGHYAPVMWTKEINNSNEAQELVGLLVSHYGSPRHEAIIGLSEKLAELGYSV